MTRERERGLVVVLRPPITGGSAHPISGSLGSVASCLIYADVRLYISTSRRNGRYEGARAVSAPETVVAQEYFLQNAPIHGAIDWHAYSQLVLRPYGWTQDDAPDEPLLKECGDLFRDEAAKPFGTWH